MNDWQIDIFNEDDEKVETRTAVSPVGLRDVIESLAMEMPHCRFVTYPEGQYPPNTDFSWPLEVE